MNGCYLMILVNLNFVMINFSLSIAVGAMYVRKYFQEDSKAVAVEMVDGVRAIYELMLKEIQWMDTETRQTALNKLRKMSTLIGYSDELMDNSKIGKFYENLSVDENNYLSLVLSINVFDTDRAFGKLREPVIKNDWETVLSPFIVNAGYAPEENGIRKPNE